MNGDHDTPAAVAGTRWDPGQYAKFGDHRLRPALELLERIPLANPSPICDLGCGPGIVTRLIAERWPGSEVIGIDNSAEMLERAREEPSRVQWVEADIRRWEPADDVELIYSNATLQWVDDHHSLIPRLIDMLPSGGGLAVQMPLSRNAVSHRLMAQILEDGGPNGTPLGDEGLRRSMARPWVLDAQTYYDLLAPRCRALDIWETEYLQVLSGEDAVLEWVKATGLRPVLNGLAEPDRSRFLESYRARLNAAYPRRDDGRTLYPFRRLFVVAVVA